MTNPQVLLYWVRMLIIAPSREHLAYFFAQICLQDMGAAVRLAEFLAYVLPDTADMWGGILQGVAEHQAQVEQSAPQPFLWTDADSADTAESIDAHLHEGGDHAPESQ